MPETASGTPRLTSYRQYGQTVRPRATDVVLKFTQALLTTPLELTNRGVWGTVISSSVCTKNILSTLLSTFLRSAEYLACTAIHSFVNVSVLLNLLHIQMFITLFSSEPDRRWIIHQREIYICLTVIHISLLCSNFIVLE